MPTVISITEKRDLEWRIKLMLCEGLHCDADEIDPGYRLKADLDMEGDRAARFFKDYGNEFHVDLTELWANWFFYFRRERIELSKGTRLAMAVAASAGLLEWAMFPHFSALMGFVTVFGIFIVIFAAVKIALRMSPPPEKPGMQEITVAQLVQAAKDGKWSVPEEIREWVSKHEPSRPLI
ncbi:MAG TPA: hypothetical protein VM554_07845 [Acidisarcina sp.]|nr:hypothetical protein [Acidisarcina sp.]